jgi:hypothetical protein
VTTSVADPAPTVDAAVRVTVCAVPGTRTKVEGEAATPAGRPERFVVTWPLKPLRASAEMLISAVPPAVKLAGEAGPARAKSAEPVDVVNV